MMTKQNRKWVFTIIIVGIAALIIQDTLNQTGPKDLPGGFEEVAFTRNEQNKGGIIRIYAFTVEDPSIADYQDCGDLMPHNDYASLTKVYFFQKGQPAPTTLDLEPPHFDRQQYQPIAAYLKGEDGLGWVAPMTPL